jgi:hypothetical protein
VARDCWASGEAVGGQGGVAGARGDVEDAFAGVDVDGAAEELADDDLFGACAGEVALGPGETRSFGHLVGGGLAGWGYRSVRAGGCGGGHGFSLN